jgi:hypothetical protein
MKRFKKTSRIFPTCDLVFLKPECLKIRTLSSYMVEDREWFDKQKNIYKKFNKSNVDIEELKPNLKKSPTGGYLVILRHPERIAHKVSDFSERISNVIPSMKYSLETIHTTLSDYGLSPNFEPNGEVLCKLSDSVEETSKNKVSIIYPSWIYNQDSVLVEGYPNSQFLRCVEELNYEANKKGIGLRLPWGGHITSNRFLRNMEGGKLTDFFKLMKEAPNVGVSEPTQIEVGYFNMGSNSFSITPYKKFNLS